MLIGTFKHRVDLFSSPAPLPDVFSREFSQLNSLIKILEAKPLSIVYFLPLGFYISRFKR